MTTNKEQMEAERELFEQAFSFTPNAFVYFDSEYEIHGKVVGRYVGRNQITEDYGDGPEEVSFCALNGKASTLNEQWAGWQARAKLTSQVASGEAVTSAKPVSIIMLNDDIELIRAVLEGFQDCAPKSDGLAAYRRIKEKVSRLHRLSVTNIMIKVVPGLDGMGEEVYAESVDDVENLLSDMAVKLDEYEGWVKPPTPSPSNVLVEALRNTVITMERQLELIAERASGDFLDKKGIVQAFQQHIKQLNKVLATYSAPSTDSVSVPTDEREEDLAVINKLSHLLAEIAIVVKGAELPLHRHGYHDLPQLIEAMKADAERYKYMREHPHVGFEEWEHISLEPADIDAAIDTARKSS